MSLSRAVLRIWYFAFFLPCDRVPRSAISLHAPWRLPQPDRRIFLAVEKSHFAAIFYYFVVCTVCFKWPFSWFFVTRNRKSFEFCVIIKRIIEKDLVPDPRNEKLNPDSGRQYKIKDPGLLRIRKIPLTDFFFFSTYRCGHRQPGQPEGVLPDGGLQEGALQGGQVARQACHPVPQRHRAQPFHCHHQRQGQAFF